MMIWDDFVKKEELETAPGVIDGELVQALMINTYPTYIREIIDTGENLFPEETAEQLETAMEMTFMSYIHTFESAFHTWPAASSHRGNDRPRRRSGTQRGYV